MISLVSLLSADLGPEVLSAAKYLLHEVSLSKFDCLQKALDIRRDTEQS